MDHKTWDYYKRAEGPLYIPIHDVWEPSGTGVFLGQVHDLHLLHDLHYLNWWTWCTWCTICILESSRDSRYLYSFRADHMVGSTAVDKKWVFAGGSNEKSYCSRGVVEGLCDFILVVDGWRDVCTRGVLMAHVLALACQYLAFVGGMTEVVLVKFTPFFVLWIVFVLLDRNSWRCFSNIHSTVILGLHVGENDFGCQILLLV